RASSQPSTLTTRPASKSETIVLVRRGSCGRTGCADRTPGSSRRSSVACDSPGWRRRYARPRAAIPSGCDGAARPAHAASGPRGSTPVVTAATVTPPATRSLITLRRPTSCSDRTPAPPLPPAAGTPPSPGPDASEVPLSVPDQRLVSGGCAAPRAAPAVGGG